MAIDFLQIREQIKKLGENALYRDHHLQELRDKALTLLKNPALDLEQLRQKVQDVAHHYDPNLRCALPVEEYTTRLDARHPLPPLPPRATILAADGSQIAPDRHAEVDYCLINVGAIQMELDSPNAPQISIQSRLLYDEELYTESGFLTDARLALERDLSERQRLADLAAEARRPVITFTDGPMELWGGREGESTSDFQRSLDLYVGVLERLQELSVTTAGYVDKPGAGLVVRLLEIALMTDQELQEVKKTFPLRGLIDIDLFRNLLHSGERSAVFAIQFKSAPHYRDDLRLHFFYLNVGRTDHPWLARIEIPAWVAKDREMIDNLQATLIQQCQITGNRSYPYLLHRAHEAALVTMEEKEQITKMISLELRNRGVVLGEMSHKQAIKQLGGRKRYSRGAKANR